MKKIIYTTLFVLLLIGVMRYMWKNDIEPTITYFPLDDTSSFEQADTQLQIHKPNEASNQLEIIWDGVSKTERRFYLRQDVSLLYKDGYFKGVLNKWKENKQTIALHQTFPIADDGYFQAISFHFGEIHHANEIKSIHTMSYANLSIDKNTKNKQKIQANESLWKSWSELLTHFDIDYSDYHFVPLADLHIYNQHTIPTLNQSATDKVMGQLWEGLYKNYVLPLLEQGNTSAKDPMPLILFDNRGTHLLVLFEQQGKKKKLIQNY